MTEEERVIIKLAADNKALRDLVDWQAAANKQLHDQIKAGIAQRYWDDKQPYTVGESKAYEIGFTDGSVVGEMEARDEFRAEIKRLREALWLIENDAISWEDATLIARAALREGKE